MHRQADGSSEQAAKPLALLPVEEVPASAPRAGPRNTRRPRERLCGVAQQTQPGDPRTVDVTANPVTAAVDHLSRDAVGGNGKLPVRSSRSPGAGKNCCGDDVQR